MRIFRKQHLYQADREKASCVWNKTKAKNLDKKKIAKLSHLSGWNEGGVVVGGSQRVGRGSQSLERHGKWVGTHQGI